MNKLWTKYEQVKTNKSWAISKARTSHAQVNKSRASYAKVMNKSWTSHDQVVNKSWTSCEQDMDKLRELVK